MPIIGHGDIAKVLPQRDDLLFFASGVSNSQETRETEYQREIDLLLQQHTRAPHIVYFSSLSIFYSGGRYQLHKLYMENLVRGFHKHTIIRIGNIDWGTNPHTLINHFKEQKQRGEKLEIQDTYRYIVDLAEFTHWVNRIPPFNCEMNIPGRRMTIQQIVDTYV